MSSASHNSPEEVSNFPQDTPETPESPLPHSESDTPLLEKENNESISVEQLDSAIHDWKKAGETRAALKTEMDIDEIKGTLKELDQRQLIRDYPYNWPDELKEKVSALRQENATLRKTREDAEEQAAHHEAEIADLSNRPLQRAAKKLGINYKGRKLRQAETNHALHTRRSEESTAALTRNDEIHTELVDEENKPINAQIAATRARLRAAEEHDATWAKRSAAINTADSTYKDTLKENDVAKSMQLFELSEQKAAEMSQLEETFLSGNVSFEDQIAAEQEITSRYARREKEIEATYEDAKEKALLTRLEGPYSNRVFSHREPYPDEVVELDYNGLVPETLTDIAMRHLELKQLNQLSSNKE